MTLSVDEPPALGRIGFGAMHLSERGRPPRPEAIDTIHAALDNGAVLVDTADAYCQHVDETGHNEVLVAEALAAWSGDQSTVTVATKGGHVRDRYGGWDVDGRPQHLISAALASRERLGVDSIALYQFHRPDPSVAFSSSVGALAQLQRDGVVARVGLSNVDVAKVQTALDVIDVASVQNELSPMVLESLPVVQWCHDAGVPFIVWAPFGGRDRGRGLADDPALQPFATHGAEVGASIHQVVLAWLLSLSPMVVPIPGASRASTIRQSLAAAAIVLDEDTVATLDRAAAQAAAEPQAGQWLEQLRARTADVEV